MRAAQRIVANAREAENTRRKVDAFPCVLPLVAKEIKR
jgi:hypothetical protein